MDAQTLRVQEYINQYAIGLEQVQHLESGIYKGIYPIKGIPNSLLKSIFSEIMADVPDFWFLRAQLDKTTQQWTIYFSVEKRRF